MNIDIGIGEKDRKEICHGLSRLLADTYMLYLQTHYFHWNVVGPMFQTLHELFEKQYREIWEAVDSIAERIRALGFPAPGTLMEFSDLSSIKEVVGVPDSDQMIQNLVAGHEAVIRTARKLLPIAEIYHDQPTLDLIANRMQIHEKDAWMLRSLLEGKTFKEMGIAS